MSNRSSISTNPEERRNAPRYPVRTYAALEISNQTWNVHLLDISATGARIAILEDHSLKPDDAITLTIELEEITNYSSLAKNLVLSGKIVHSREHIIGIELTNSQADEKQKLLELLHFFSEMNF